MIHEYLQRGVAAGLIAGFVYGLYIAFVANPLSRYVDDVAHGHDPGHGGGHAHEPAGDIVSETTGAVLSAGSGVLWAIFLGGVFAVALYVLEPALPGRGDAKAYVFAGAGFFSVSATPWLVLPPAAPGSEHLYGINSRLGMYLGLVVVGIGLSALAVGAYKRFARTHLVLGVLAGSIPILAATAVLPASTPTIVTHPTLPGDLVVAYRGLAVLSQAALWLLLAGTFTRLRRWRTPESRGRPTGEALTNL